MKSVIRQKTRFPMLAALVCACLLIVSIFLPYVTAVDEYQEFMEATGQDTVLSLFDFGKQFLQEGESAFPIILGIFSGLTAIAALLAICRKPLGVLFFDILISALTVVIYMIFGCQDNLANGYFTLGIGSTLMFTACAALLISSVWMLVAKIAAKKGFSLNH